MKAIEEAKLMLKEKLKKSKHFSKFKEFYIKRDQLSTSIPRHDRTISNAEAAPSNNNDLQQTVGLGCLINAASSRASDFKPPMVVNHAILQDSKVAAIFKHHSKN